MAFLQHTDAVANHAPLDTGEKQTFNRTDK